MIAMFSNELLKKVKSEVVTSSSDTELDMKTEVKDSDIYSQNMTEIFSTKIGNNIKSEVSSSVYEIPIKTEIEEDTPFPNFFFQSEREYPKDTIMTTSNCHKGKIDIKEEPWWLERGLTEAPSVFDEIKDEMNEGFTLAESPRIFTGRACRNKSAIIRETNFHLRNKASESEVTTGCKSQENVYLENSEVVKMNDITSCMQQNNFIRQNDTHKNCTCKPGLLKGNLSCVCHIGLTQLADLQKHKLIHEGKKLYKCDICSKSFTELGNLKRHKLIHEGIKPFKCSICGKSFAELGNLKKHKLIHEGKKPFKCDICYKSFTLLGNLKQHKLIHEVNKPFKCDICCKSFTRLGLLKRHKLYHEGKRPHMCDICKKHFTELTTLKRHKWTHEGRRPHMCDICKKGFTQLGSLKTHKLIHEGKKPFR